VLAPDLTKAIKLAYQALLLVERGASERGAIIRAAQLDPDLAAAKHEAMDLLLTTLNRQDQLDQIILQAFQGRQVGSKTRCLFRLATQLFQASKSLESLRRVERAFRSFTRPEDIASLEFLLGIIVAGTSRPIPSMVTGIERLAMDTHFPTWWVEYCNRVFGRGETVKLLTASPRPRYIRVNPLRNHGRTSLPREARSVSSSLTKVGSAPDSYTLNGSPSALSEFFSMGLFQMQDRASLLAVQAAGPMPGENVLDVCAAPGGKTVTLAQFMKNRGKIISVDYSATRMRSWGREISRLGVRIAEPLVSDAACLALRGEFDLIVVDPPCSGTGILDRNPSMKWHLSQESIERYSNLQQRILESVSGLVSESGRILYCTCSLTIEENENVVSAFLKSHPEFETRPVLVSTGTSGLGGFSDCRRLWPHRDMTAGYFIARMQRTM
jgi:16S rRNA (cytosine967-C5)-methyltransferase